MKLIQDNISGDFLNLSSSTYSKRLEGNSKLQSKLFLKYKLHYTNIREQITELSKFE